MRVWMMTDMEGVCGVVDHDNWVTPEGRYYDAGKELLTMEVNAAVDGFVEAGATEVVVVDGHGYGGINPLALDSRALYCRMYPGRHPFLLDEGFDVAAWIGQHPKAGTEYAHIAHTGWFDVLDFKINGISVGEFGELAMCAELLGTQSILCCGDEAFAREAAALVPGIETVATKRGLTPGTGDECDTTEYRARNLSAVHLSPERAQALIREGAYNALTRFNSDRSSFGEINIKPPFEKVVKVRQDGDSPARILRAVGDDLPALLHIPGDEV